MNDDYICPKADGNVQGDSHPMPYREVGDMAPSNAVTDGANLGSDATNTIGKIRRDTGSDPIEEA